MKVRASYKNDQHVKLWDVKADCMYQQKNPKFKQRQG